MASEAPATAARLSQQRRQSVDGRSSPEEAQPDSSESSSQEAADQQQPVQEGQGPSTWRRALAFVLYTPKNCRYDDRQPLRYSLTLNVLFGLTAMVTVANLYYTHPILNVLAQDFGVTDEQSSIIPTVAQAGYAVGLVFVCPLGDLLKRRPFVLLLMFLTPTIWIGLCITQSFSVFAALTFITSLTTVTPQIMLPLVADLAPPHRRATAISIVTSGLLLGLLFARIMSGVVTNFISWRYVYWIALGLQYIFLAFLWFAMPDYPQTNKNISYSKILWTIVTILVKSPVLVQACLIGFFMSSCFTSFWTTLTFLLAGEPYNYSSLVIGLFALIGFGTMTFGPPYSRFVIDKYVPLFSVILAALVQITGITIGTYIGTYTIAGPVIQAVMLDLGLQVSQISNRTAIYAIAPKARNRVNTAYMFAVFCGQLMGTSVGNHLYAQGGWIRSGSASVGFMGAALVIALLRGPWELGWIGWRGGWGIRRRDLPPKNKDEEKGEKSKTKDNVLGHQSVVRDVGDEKARAK